MYGITENGDTVRPQSADDLDDRETDVQEKGRLQIAGAAMSARVFRDQAGYVTNCTSARFRRRLAASSSLVNRNAMT